MKTIIILGACLASILTQAAFAEDEYFHRKPGLWEISMTTESHPGKTTPIKYCLDKKPMLNF